MTMNLNELAVFVTNKEGKLKSLPIGQIKEVMKILLSYMKKLTFTELYDLLKRVK